MPAPPVLNVGFYNYVVSAHVTAFVASDSAPMRRLVQHMRKEGSVIDATQGRKTKSLVFLSNHAVVLSAVSQETLSRRWAGEIADAPEDDGEFSE